MSNELWLPPTKVNPKNGRFQKGHVPANKGKKWDEFMSKRSQRRCAKGWVNVEKYRPKKRSDIAGRCKKKVVVVTDDGKFKELKNGQSEMQAFDMQVSDLISCIDSALDRMSLHSIEAKDVLQRAAAKWFAHYVAMNYGQGEEQELTAVCNELGYEAIEEFVKLDAEIQAMGDALLEE